MPELVRNMREEGPARANRPRHIDRLSQMEMGRMRSMAQRVEDEAVEPAEQRHRRLGDSVAIGEICEGAEAKPEHIPGPVLDRHRHDFLPAD